MENNNIPQVNNSKKISQLKGRDAITYHQDHSWIAVAQYNDRIGSYHNIAMNIASITGYSISKTIEASNELIDAMVDTYYLAYTAQLGYFVNEYDYDKISYMIEPQSMTYNIMSYAAKYAEKQLMWDYYPSNEYVNVKIDYLITDDNEYILTDKGKKLRVER